MGSGPRLKRSREAEPSQAAPINPSKELTALHRTRLVSWNPSAVLAIAPSADGSVFAVGYENARIEIWDAVTFTCCSVLPGEEGAELTSLAWVTDCFDGAQRLFCARLDGQVHELCLQQLRPKASTDSYGGAVWQLAPEPAASVLLGDAPRVALACDDGSVRLFTVEGGVPGAQYQRTLAQVEGRVLTVAWHPTGKSLLSSGTDGCIHCWEVSTGHELMRITAAVSTKQPVCVWRLAVLPDGSIVSGSSDGATQFWDGAFGTLLQRFAKHSSDVLAIEASPDGRDVFASGVDSRVALFRKVSGGPGQPERWAYLDYKAPHSHDVRALALLKRPDGAVLLSGGNDTHILAYSVPNFLKEHPIRLSRCPQRPLLLLSRLSSASRKATDAAAQLISVERNSIDVWQLGTAAAAPSAQQSHGNPHHASDGAEHEGDALELTNSPLLLARIAASSSLHIGAAAAARCAGLLAVSDVRRARAFRLTPNDAEASAAPRIEPVALPRGLPAATALAFAPNGSVLYAADGRGVIRAVTIGGDGSGGESEVAAAATVPAGETDAGPAAAAAAGCVRYMPRVSRLAVSPDGRWLAAASGAAAHVYALPELKLHGTVAAAGGGAAAGGNAAAHSGAAGHKADHGAPGAASASGAGSHASATANSGSASANTSKADDRSHIIALDFQADGALLAIATAANGVTVYATASCAPTQWSLNYAGVLREYLQRLPGNIEGLSFTASPQGKGLVIYTPGGFCHADPSKPVLSAPLHAPPRKRGKFKPGADANVPRLDPGANCRLFTLEHPCLFLGYTAADAAVLVEKPWAEVLRRLPPPLYKHRYGA